MSYRIGRTQCVSIGLLADTEIHQTLDNCSIVEWNEDRLAKHAGRIHFDWMPTSAGWLNLVVAWHRLSIR